MTTSPSPSSSPARPAAPEPDGDFYLVSRTLSEEDNALRLKVRAFMEAEVQPIINDYWERDEFPFELAPKSTTLMGFVLMELARVDALGASRDRLRFEADLGDELLGLLAVRLTQEAHA